MVGVNFPLGGEIGYNSAPNEFVPWTRQEYNPELLGLRGLEVYDKMRRGDGTVRESLRMVKTPVLAASWYVEAASESSRDQNIANYIWKNLTERMSISFPQMMNEILLMLDFGFSLLEKVFDQDEDGMWYWKKLAPRHPMDIEDWEFDENGGPVGVTMYAPDLAPLDSNYVFIPIEKLVAFSFDSEGGDVLGRSVLRSAYKHWYYKDNLYKVDAIQKERHGIGIPHVELPPNWEPDDKKEAEELARNLRTNERAYVVTPPGWVVDFLKPEGNLVDCMNSVEHHDAKILANILADFLNPSTRSDTSTLQQMFLEAVSYVTDIIAENFNLYVIPQLVDFNWTQPSQSKSYPKLRVRRIGKTADWRTLSFALRNLIGANIIRPDDRLEKLVRDEMDLPPVDTKTIHLTPQQEKLKQDAANADKLAKAAAQQSVNGVTQQGGTQNAPGSPSTPNVGPPRQSPSPPVGTGKANVGTDTSGGK